MAVYLHLFYSLLQRVYGVVFGSTRTNRLSTYTCLYIQIVCSQNYPYKLMSLSAD